MRDQIHTRRGAVIDSGFGYDGQYVRILARNPLMPHAQTLTTFARPSVPPQRIASPALRGIVAAMGEPPLR